MVWRALAFAALGLIGFGAATVQAAECANPNALGTSRVLAVDPQDYPRLGTIQYSRSLPLEDHEVVLTFDDGPLPPYSNRVLDVLAENCVKATYFIIGRMARGYPDLLKRIRAEGHTIGNHSQNHPLAFEKMPIDAVVSEIEQGAASIAATLGERRPPSPFFRIPGLLRAKEVENYLQSRGLATFSADVVADDWRHINGSEVVRRAITRLDERGKGILLLHDIQPATALALPELLRQLKAKGYRVVHVVPRGAVPPLRDVPVAAAPQPPAPAPAPQPLAVAVMVPAPEPARPEPEPQAAPAPAVAAKEVPANEALANDSFARAEPVVIVPGNPIRPFTSSAKPARSMPTPGKFVTTEPGGWPPVISVPVPKAGGVGVSSVTQGASSGPDGRFR